MKPKNLYASKMQQNINVGCVEEDGGSSARSRKNASVNQKDAYDRPQSGMSRASSNPQRSANRPRNVVKFNDSVPAAHSGSVGHGDANVNLDNYDIDPNTFNMIRDDRNVSNQYLQ